MPVAFAGIERSNVQYRKFVTDDGIIIQEYRSETPIGRSPNKFIFNFVTCIVYLLIELILWVNIRLHDGILLCGARRPY